MTKKELTGERPLSLSRWMRESLPDSSTGQSITDLDFILFNWKTRKMMFVETKTRGAYIKKNQQVIFNLLHTTTLNGINFTDWEYLGFHTIIFENTFFNDGKVYWDNVETTEEELILKLTI